MTEDLKSGQREIVMMIFMAFSHSSADSKSAPSLVLLGSRCVGM